MDEKTIARFWSYVDVLGEDECWCWKGGRIMKRGGYGQFGITVGEKKHKVLYSHRLAFQLANPGVPVPRLVMHSCDNPPCCNPKHLVSGTHRRNTDDMMAKGRHRTVALMGESHGGHILTVPDVIEIRRLCASGFRHRDIAEQFGVKRPTVTAINNRRLWKHVA